MSVIPHLCYRFFSGGVRIACAECHPPLEMCAECFAARVEVGNHKSYHSYRYNYQSELTFVVRFKENSCRRSSTFYSYLVFPIHCECLSPYLAPCCYENFIYM
jgi:hypothetical protein